MTYREVKLNPAEFAFAETIGKMRQGEALRLGLPDRHGAQKEDGLRIHCVGAAGEIAVAKALGVYYEPTVNTFKEGGDVGPYQVRTRLRHKYELLVRDGDRSEDAFVLVTREGREATFRVHGWLHGGDAKRSDWYHAHGGRDFAYFVPQLELRPLEELPTWIGVAA